MYLSEQLLIFFGCVLGNLVNFALIHYFLRDDVHYKKLEYHQKCYMVKNLSKSIILLTFLVSGIRMLFNGLVYQEYNDYWMTIYGSVYVSTDFTGLLVVPNLHMTTIIHHICVILFGVINLLVNFDENGFHRVLLPLTAFSCVPYIVNFYLAHRWCPLPFKGDYLIKFCFWIYSISIIFNFIYQHYFVFYLYGDHPFHYIYLFLYYWAILRDDIKLLQYLLYKGYGVQSVKEYIVNIFS
jgi:hypothetical protein